MDSTQDDIDPHKLLKSNQRTNRKNGEREKKIYPKSQKRTSQAKPALW